MSNRPGGFGGRGNKFLTEKEKAQRPKVTKELLVRISDMMKPYWKQLIIVVFTILVSSIFTLIPAILTGRIIDEGLIGGNLPLLVRLIILSLGVTLMANLIGVLESYLTTWISEHVTFDLRNRMFRHLQSMSHGFFTDSRQGDIITRMTSDISGVQRTLSSTMTGIISNVLTLIIALIAMYQKNWVLATLGIILVPLFVLPTKKVGKTRWTLTREAQQSQDEINGILNETLSVSGQLLVKLFGQEETEAQRYEKINKKMITLNIRESMAGRWFRVALSTFSSIGPMLIYLVGGYLMIKRGSSLSVGDITVLVSLLGRMYGPVNSLMGIQVDWIRSMALFTRIFEYFDLNVDVKNVEHPQKIEEVKGTVEFNNVGFSYDDKPILKNINFKLESGKRIALVGPSGAGKSTLVNLVLRLYDVSNGSVTLDGIDVRELDLEFLRQQIGLVTQDTYLFQGTIKENLLYAKPDASDEEIESACKKANIHDFIQRQKHGYDSTVGNRVLKLSGGEKQRISIARVLLKDPTIIIFDEATSALDSISENLIQDAMEELMKSRTSIMIAHRLSTIQSADQILVMANGIIEERGTHTELLNNTGLYHQLWETQSIGGESLETDSKQLNLDQRNLSIF